MKKRLTIILTIAVVFSVMTLGAALAKKMPKGIEIGDSVVATAEVVAIDKVDRMIMLRSPEGKLLNLEVGEEARNFNQIAVGDMLTVEYYESIALYIGEKGTQPNEEAGIITARTAKGEKPGAVVVEAVDVSVIVKAINKKKRILKLKMPDGRVVKTNVDKSIEAFDNLKKGDSIHVRLTEAVAISIDKP